MNESDVRVMRELCRAVMVDLGAAKGEVKHAQRTTARLVDLGARAGVPDEDNNALLDALAVADHAVAHVLRMTEMAMDIAVVDLRDPCDIGAEFRRRSSAMNGEAVVER